MTCTNCRTKSMKLTIVGKNQYCDACLFQLSIKAKEANMEKLPISPTKSAKEVVDQANEQYNKGDFDTWSYEVLKNIEKVKTERD